MKRLGKILNHDYLQKLSNWEYNIPKIRELCLRPPCWFTNMVVELAFLRNSSKTAKVQKTSDLLPCFRKVYKLSEKYLFLFLARRSSTAQPKKI